MAEIPKGNKIAGELYTKLEGKLHELQREAVMAVVNNKDFQFGSVLALQMNLRAVIQLESELLAEAFGVEAMLKRERMGYVEPDKEVTQ